MSKRPHANRMSSATAPLRIAIVLWNGDVGGAEVYSVALARQLQKLGVEVSLVFIENPYPLAARLQGGEIPYSSVGLSRGRDILHRPRRYAAAVESVGPDGAMLVTCGFMGAALRAGGYSGSIVAVEHGDVIAADFYSAPRRLLWRLGRAAGAWADDLEVGVSDFILERMSRLQHPGTGQRIYNGIDPDEYRMFENAGPRTDKRCVVAFAGRLVPGKGADYLIRAAALTPSPESIRLLIAGEGPERGPLKRLADSLGLGDCVEFAGLRHDMPALWHSCDIAAVPSAEFIESCPMTPLEAMACGKPVVATSNGGLPELVVDGVTGLVVPPRDASRLATALSRYAENRDLRVAHGTAAQAHVIENFHIADSARAYLDLFERLAHSHRRRF